MATRMFVLEIRGYMQDADATGQLDPIGRVSLHEDTNSDGVYDKHTVFVDKLVFPRFATPFGPNALLVKESNAQEVWKYTDTNNDGVADKKELFDTGFGRLGNVEHQESHLTWGLDNWLYSTENAFRARWTPHGVIKEPTGNGGAQWGVVQDNDGKMWFPGRRQRAAGLLAISDSLRQLRRRPREAAVARRQTPTRSSQWMPDLWHPLGRPDPHRRHAGRPLAPPACPMNSCAARQPAPAETSCARTGCRPTSRATTCTAKWSGALCGACGPRTSRGRHHDSQLLRRERVHQGDGPLLPSGRSDHRTQRHGLHHGHVPRAHRQEATWSGPGTYLRARIQQYDLDKVIHHGRIWRLVYDGVKADRSDALPRDTAMPHMNTETAAQLATRPSGAPTAGGATPHSSCSC